MLKIIRSFLPILVLVALALACVSPGAAPNAPALDQNAIEIAIEQTSAAAASQTARADPLFGVESPTPTLTRVPSMTPLPTFTQVVFVTLVRVTKNTNCRAGPGNVYPAVGVLRVGEVAEAVGRSANALYWIIRNPDRPGETCWLSGQYATVTGAAGALRVLTPPPTPKPTRTNTPKPKPTRTRTPKPKPSATSSTPATPPQGTIVSPSSFRATYNNMDNCAGRGWWADIRLENISQSTYQSISIAARDTVTGDIPTVDSDDFLNFNGCGAPDVLDALPPGATAIVSSAPFSYDFVGHELEVLITLCTGTGRTGTCVSREISFTP
jgi:hypothetical protein